MKKSKVLCMILTVVLMAVQIHSVWAVEEDPEPTPTAEVSEAPTEEVTPEPTVTEDPTDTPTPEPSVTEGPTPTEPIATDTPTPTPAGTTPSATPTPKNTPTPVLTGTPTPTVTEGPTMTPTGTPYATVVPPVLNETYPEPKSVSDKSVTSKSPSVVKIDGIYDEVWDNIEATQIKNVSWGESGANGSFRVYWDKNTLFILVDVNDDTPDTASDRFTRQDCVEIFVNESGTKPETYSEGDSHFKVNRDGAVEYGNGADKSIIDFAVIPKENGYMVEAAVTFTTINPVFGQAIGFDVRINDSQGNQYRDYMLQWSDTSMYTYENLSKIGTLYLK